MVVEVDGLFIVLLGDALIDAMEARQVLREHEGRTETVHVVCERKVVPCVSVANHHTCTKRDSFVVFAKRHNSGPQETYQCRARFYKHICHH